MKDEKGTTEPIRKVHNEQLVRLAWGKWKANFEALALSLNTFSDLQVQVPYGEHDFCFVILDNPMSSVPLSKSWMIGAHAYDRESLMTWEFEPGKFAAKDGEPYAEILAREASGFVKVELWHNGRHPIALFLYLTSLWQALVEDGLESEYFDELNYQSFLAWVSGTPPFDDSEKPVEPVSLEASDENKALETAVSEQAKESNERIVICQKGDKHQLDRLFEKYFSKEKPLNGCYIQAKRGRPVEPSQKVYGMQILVRHTIRWNIYSTGKTEPIGSIDTLQIPKGMQVSFYTIDKDTQPKISILVSAILRKMNDWGFEWIDEHPISASPANWGTAVFEQAQLSPLSGKPDFDMEERDFSEPARASHYEIEDEVIGTASADIYRRGKLNPGYGHVLDDMIAAGRMGEPITYQDRDLSNNLDRKQDSNKEHVPIKSRKRMSEMRKARALIFKKIKDSNPTLSYQGVANHANANYSDEIGKIAEEYDVRNDYKAMGWTWQRADRIR